MTDDLVLAITVEKAAKALGVSRTSIYELIAAGKFPSVRFGGSRRIPVEGLRRWIVEHTEGPITTDISDIIVSRTKETEDDDERSNGHPGARPAGVATKDRPANDRGQEDQGSHLEPQRRDRRDARGRRKGGRP